MWQVLLGRGVTELELRIGPRLFCRLYDRCTMYIATCIHAMSQTFSRAITSAWNLMRMTVRWGSPRSAAACTVTRAGCTAPGSPMLEYRKYT
jgi:hypothetical protein